MIFFKNNILLKIALLVLYMYKSCHVSPITKLVLTQFPNLSGYNKIHKRYSYILTSPHKLKVEEELRTWNEDVKVVDQVEGWSQHLLIDEQRTQTRLPMTIEVLDDAQNGNQFPHVCYENVEQGSQPSRQYLNCHIIYKLSHNTTRV